MPKIYLNNERVETAVPSEHNLAKIYVYGTADGSPQILKCRLNYLEDESLLAIQQTLPHFNTITELHLDFCSLSYDHVIFLRMILAENRNIIFFSMNGNPNMKYDEECKHILPIEATSLKMLSEQFCDLGPKDAFAFQEILTKPDMQTSCLVSLNLASNKLGNEGCIAIASILRANRFLQSVNISDNQIKESALLQLCDAFGKFELSKEEIAFKRMKTMEILQKQSGIDLGVSINRSKVSNEISKSSVSKSFFSNVSSSTLLTNHPFLNDTHKEGDHLYCVGNYSLMYLNISFNEITPKVLEKLIEVAQYQKKTFHQPSGLVRVLLESSEENEECSLLKDRLNIAIAPAVAKQSFKRSISSSN